MKFPNHPRGVNPKIWKKWKGVFRVTKIVGKVNLMVQLSTASKPILVHMDRVRHLTLKENEASFDSKLPKAKKLTILINHQIRTQIREQESLLKVGRRTKNRISQAILIRLGTRICMMCKNMSFRMELRELSQEESWSNRSQG